MHNGDIMFMCNDAPSATSSAEADSTQPTPQHRVSPDARRFCVMSTRNKSLCLSKKPYFAQQHREPRIRTTRGNKYEHWD